MTYRIEAARPRPLLLGLLVAVFGTVPAAGSGAGKPAAAALRAVTDADVARQIVLLQEHLATTQLPNGSWRYAGNADQCLGMTALAILALKHSGLPNDHPAVAAGVRYIASHKSQYTYAEGLVPCALELVDPKAYKERISYSLRYLMAAQNGSGYWGYTPGPRGDNSCTQFAILGLAAAGRCGLPDKPAEAARFKRVRARAVAHWKRTQSVAGGWGYNSGQTMQMTCAGLASLYLLGEHLETPGSSCGVYDSSKAMQLGLNCLGKFLKQGKWSPDGYSLYALERVGVLLDLRLIQGTDWYRHGASVIVSSGLKGGRWGASGSAFHLLFLAKGNAPIAIAKWCWGGDWNKDHSDVRAWVDHAGKELDSRFDWWESKLDGPRCAAVNASMIFVNGHGKFRATDAELDILRRFLLKKGTVVAEGCCNSKRFIESFQRVMCERLFPGQRSRFVPLKPGHSACAGVHRLTPHDVGGVRFVAGCRKLKMVLLKRDISCALNGERRSRQDLARARKVATNLLAWALETRKPGGKLSRESVEELPLELLTVDQLKRRKGGKAREFRLAMGRLIHRGEWDVDPRLFSALNAELELHRGAPTFECELCVSPASEDLFEVPFLFMAGHEDPDLEEKEYLHLRTYVQNGGFVFISCCCGSEPFDRGVRRLLRRMLPNDDFVPIPEDDPVWTTPNACRAAPATGTDAYEKAHGRGWAPLLGVSRKGRWAVVYSPVDVCCSLEDDLIEDIPAYRRRSAVSIMVNVIHRAFSP
ncbi:MAG: DUF4159 domain-containing protein [Planctomycetota bacterium]